MECGRLGGVVRAVLAWRAVGRVWPPWVTGLAWTGFALVVAVSVQLIALGGSPMDVVIAGP